MHKILKGKTPGVSKLKHNLRHDVFRGLPLLEVLGGGVLLGPDHHLVPPVDAVLAGLADLLAVSPQVVVRDEGQHLGPGLPGAEDVLVDQTKLLKVVRKNASGPVLAQVHTPLDHHLLGPVLAPTHHLVNILQMKGKDGKSFEVPEGTLPRLPWRLH